MKGKLMMTLVALATFGFVSCDKEVENNASFSSSTYNYVVHLDGEGEPVIKKGYYTFVMDYETKKLSISTDMVDMGTDDDVKFTTNEIKYNTSVVNFNGGVGTVIYGTELTPGTTTDGRELRNLRFELSPLYYEPPTITYTKDDTSPLPQPDLTYRKRTTGRNGEAPKMLYQIGEDYMVYTFWPDLYYNGVTKTSVMGDDNSTFESQDVGYRLKFDIAKKKATVVLYNVQFNPQMPKMECLILPDLDVEFTNNGYIVDAHNVVPLYIENMKIMENPRFPFTTFRFVAETNMVEGTCEFTVAGRFYGSFIGKYMEFIVR